MEVLSQLSVSQVLLVAVGVSFLLNLVLLGVFLGRNDRQTLRLMTKARQDREALYRDLAKEVMRLKQAQLGEYNEIRRTLARMEIRVIFEDEHLLAVVGRCPDPMPVPVFSREAIPRIADLIQDHLHHAPPDRAAERGERVLRLLCSGEAQES